MHVNEFTNYLHELAELINLEFSQRHINEPTEWPLEMDHSEWMDQLEAYVDHFPTIGHVESAVRKLNK